MVSRRNNTDNAGSQQGPMETKKPKKTMKEVPVKYPEYIGSSFASILVFIMGASMRGE